MLAKRSTTIMLIAFAMMGCQGVRPPVAEPLAAEGFEAFPTPRAFDAPGTIYRVDSGGKRFEVSTLPVSPRARGEEAIPKMTRTSEISLKQLVETLGAKAAALPVKATSNLSSTSSTTVESTSGVRTVLSDDELNAALSAWATNTRPAPGNTYYVIRETIAAPGVTYKVSQNWLASLDLDVKSLKAAGYNGEAKAGANNTLELDTKFGKNLNVWYKSEEVTFSQALGAGPNQFVARRTPLTRAAPGLQ
jgi:hypothetical protein